MVYRCPYTSRGAFVVLAAFALAYGAFPHSAAALERESVTWSNGDVTLAGTLYLPEGRGPHPAFVFLHGSGPETRGAFTMKRYAREFANNGIIMLQYDKRGAGDSTGDWLKADYEDLARDAAAGIELLARRPDVDPSAIGVIGASEGGWTAPLAANFSEHVSMAILISAPPMSPREQGLFEYGVELRKSGLGAREIEDALALNRRMLKVWRTNEGWEELAVAVELAKTQGWYEKAGRPGLPDVEHPQFAWYRRIMDYDPIPALKRLDVPALLFYGAKDELVDADASPSIMRALAEAEKKDFTIVIYPEGTHNLTSDGIRFPDGHWRRIVEWIRDQQ